jgi:hypothetical protein
MKQTLKQAGFKYIRYSSTLHAHVLEDETGKRELWVANKNHASFGISYKNTHLEFAADYIPFYGVSIAHAQSVFIK